MTFYSNPKRDYVLNPRGKALYDDSNRFGTKMLEKMGWSKGKGLGANLNGQLEFIKVSHKGDQKGVGFKDRDDQWTTHESNFNSLLTSFQSAENSDEESQNCAVQRFQNDENSARNKKDAKEKEELFSGVSLEERSKNSRARVHYKKFTRGKDLSRYSEKDLANIFGKKSLKCDTETEVSTPESNDDDSSDKPSENTPNFGITTIETGTTINDYFKNKMKNIVNGAKKSPNEQDQNAEADVSSNKREKKRSKKSKSSEFPVQDLGAGDNNQDISKKIAVHLEPPLINESVKEGTTSTMQKNRNRERKKKSTNKSVEPLDSDKNLEVEILSAPKKTKKVKAEKVPVNEVETISKTFSEADCETVTEQEIQRSKKNKKSKSDDVNESQSSGEIKYSNETIIASDSHNPDSESVQPKKKSKKNRENKQIEPCDDATPPLAAKQHSTNLFEVVSNVSCSPEVVTDNVYEIRRYRTEIFRYVDLHAFPNSTLIPD